MRILLGERSLLSTLPKQATYDEQFIKTDVVVGKYAGLRMHSSGEFLPEFFADEELWRSIRGVHLEADLRVLRCVRGSQALPVRLALEQIAHAVEYFVEEGKASLGLPCAVDLREVSHKVRGQLLDAHEVVTGVPHADQHLWGRTEAALKAMNDSVVRGLVETYQNVPLKCLFEPILIAHPLAMRAHFNCVLG